MTRKDFEALAVALAVASARIALLRSPSKCEIHRVYVDEIAKACQDSSLRFDMQRFKKAAECCIENEER